MAAQPFAGRAAPSRGRPLEFYGTPGCAVRAVEYTFRPAAGQGHAASRRWTAPGGCRGRSDHLAARYVLERARADAAGLAPMADARTIVASAVQQRLCTIAQLAGELGQRHRGRDALLRAVLAEVADGVRSAPEGDLRALIISAGLPCRSTTRGSS